MIIQKSWYEQKIQGSLALLVEIRLNKFFPFHLFFDSRNKTICFLLIVIINQRAA